MTGTVDCPVAVAVWPLPLMKSAAPIATTMRTMPTAIQRPESFLRRGSVVVAMGCLSCLMIGMDSD